MVRKMVRKIKNFLKPGTTFIQTGLNTVEVFIPRSGKAIGAHNKLQIYSSIVDFFLLKQFFMPIRFIGLNVFKRYRIGASTLNVAVSVVIKTCYIAGHGYAPESKNVLV